MLVADLGQVAISLIISTGVVVSAGLLSFYQWKDRRHRHPESPGFDAAYFTAQDARRYVGALILVLVAIGLSIGARIKHIVNGHANLPFVVVWVSIMGLIVLLLLLAAFDWMATRRYANRQVKSMARERLELLRETVRRPDPPTNGRPADLA